MFNSRLRRPSTRHWLTGLMKRYIGYKAKSDGICLGVALMGIQDALISLDAFYQRRDDLYDLSTQGIPGIDVSEDTLAYLKGVMLNQAPYRHTALSREHGIFLQDPIASLRITSSLEIKNQGGIVLVSEHSGVYGGNDLRDYFSCLTDARNEHGKEVPPFAMLLRSGEHAAAIYFDANKQTFHLLNEDASETSGFTCIAALVKAIQSEFEETACHILSTQIVCTQINLEKTRLWVDSWLISKSHTTLHEITTARVNASNREGVTWLMLAIQHQDISTALKIIESGANVKTERPRDGMTPLCMAAIVGSSPVVEALLRKGLNPCNRVGEHNLTPSESAALMQHKEVAEILVTAERKHRLTRYIGTYVRMFPRLKPCQTRPSQASRPAANTLN